MMLWLIEMGLVSSVGLVNGWGLAFLSGAV